MLISVQALRAIAAWVVVCHHFMQIFFDFKASGPIGEFFVSRGAVGVDIFFVISGLVIYLSTCKRDIPASQFIAQRLFRIVPAYWLYTLAMGLLLLWAAPWLPHQVIGWQNFILSLFFLPSENPGGYGLYPTLNVGWTLNYEMFFYLLFSLVFLFERRVRPLIITVALLAVTELLARKMLSGSLPGRFYGNDIVYEFLLGIGIGMAYQRGWIREALWLPLAGLALGVMLILQLDNSQRLLHWGLPSALIVLCCVSLEPLFRGSELLKKLGDCSYSVYLLHVLVLYGGLLLAQRYSLNPYLVFAFCVPIIAGGAWLSYEWIEKGLYQRMKAWLDTRRTARQAVALS
ncbi:acyltransferase [uncultured Pseudomonas sp.]|uniref:acyltransferase family protein n=1 Tax=uncultured Pseudomonas sp. TaxID=114707 RepID=UPI0025E1D4C4|nr:acyltransferase [uncultured Pseudomonas sp.]